MRATACAMGGTGYIALRFGERVALRRQALRAYWLRMRQAPIAREIDTRRRELVEMVEAELGDSRLRLGSAR